MADLKMNCKNVGPLLDSYHDGELCAEEKANVEGHVSSCQPCTEKLNDIQLVVSALKALPRRSAPRDFSENIDTIINAKPTNVVSFNARKVAWGSVSVAAAVALFVFGLRLMPGGNTSVANKNDSTTTSVVASQNARDGVQQTAVVQRSTDSAARKADSKNVVDKKPIASQDNGSKAGQVHIDKQTVASLSAGSSFKSVNPAAREEAGDAQVAAQGVSQPGQISKSMQVASVASAPDLVAVSLYDESTSVTDELGITTDEDGLYALKL